MEKPIDSAAALFGRITAGYTHDVRNILSIIKESAGLLEDLVSLADDSVLPHKPKYIKTLATIKNQIERGVVLSAGLNWFAHSTDHATASISVPDLLENLVMLTQRFGRLKGVSLKLAGHRSGHLTLVTRPVALQQVLFAILDCFIALLPAQSEIEIEADRHEDHLTVEIRPITPPGVGAEPLAASQDLMQETGFQQRLNELGATIRTAEFPGGLCVVLPLKPPA